MFDFAFTQRDFNLILMMTIFGVVMISMIFLLGYLERKARRGK